jgi:hypothetical protein
MNTHGNALRADCALYRYVTHPASAAIVLVVVMFGCFVSFALAYPGLAQHAFATPRYVWCGSIAADRAAGLGSGGGSSASGRQGTHYCHKNPKGPETFTQRS